MFFVGVSGSFLPYILAIAFSWVVFGKGMFTSSLAKNDDAAKTSVIAVKQAPIASGQNTFHYSHQTSSSSLAEAALCLRCVSPVTRAPEPLLYVRSVFLLSPEKRGPPVC